MKPIPSPASREAMDLLNKAMRLLEKAEELDMVEHEGEDVPAFAADGKGPKDKKKGKKCPECQGEGDDCECDDEDEGPQDEGDDDIKLEKGKCKCKKGESCRDCEKCPECGEAMNKGSCMKMGCGAKMQKAKDCPECGAKMEKGACMKMGCGAKMQKAEPGFSTTFGFEPQNIMFASESGGQTRNAYYSTNQYVINSQDVANKGGQSSSINFDGLSAQLNPHDGGGADRQVQGESLTKQQIAQSRASGCHICGGNLMTGCLKGFGPTCRGLQG